MKELRIVSWSRWTQEASDKAAKLWEEGFSATQIGMRLGMSRNAVIGRIHRLGLSKPKLEGGRKRATTRRSTKRVLVPRQPRKATPRPVTGNITRVQYFHGMTTVAPMPIPRADDVARVSFADLEDHHCRFIPGEPSDGYCGLQKVPGTSYCAGHLQRCYSTVEITRHMAAHERIGGETTLEATVEEILVPA